MIKILLLIPTLDRSGAEKQFTLLATRLPRNQFDVHTATLTRGGPFADELRKAEIPLTILYKRWKCDPLAYYRLRRLIADIKPDILHAWLFASNAYGRLSVGRCATTKVLVSERCVDTWKSGWQLWLDRRLTSRTTRLIANSNSVADFYQQHGYLGQQIVVIPNGAESPGGPDFDRDQALAEFDIPAGAKVVGFTGRLARQKRVKDLIWAIQLLRQLTDNVYFLIVGDGPERVRLEELSRQLGCAPVTRFAGHRHDAARLIGLMNVFWLASDFEGMSNSVMEAMSAGVPVVTSDIPPNRELVTDGKTGFLVKVGDSVGFAQFADRILADDELAQKLGNAGRERIRNDFSVEKMVSAHADLYRRVMHR